MDDKNVFVVIVRSESNVGGGPLGNEWLQEYLEERLPAGSPVEIVQVTAVKS